MPQKRVFHYQLPFPPSLNSYYRRHGHTIHISPKGVKFRKAVVALLTKVPYTSCELKVYIGYWRPDNRVRDLDNYQKAIYDALKHARVYPDDKQIVDKHEKWLGLDPLGIGSAHITIEEL